MRAPCFTAILLTCAVPGLPAQQADALPHLAAPAAESHHDLARAVTEFLSRVEVCLRGCTDAASVAAAMPQLRELADEARRLQDAQRLLPEPTVQDYMASQELALQFLPLWKTIRAHAVRLEKDGLMTDELRLLLQKGSQGS